MVHPIKKYRKERGLTQAALAKKLHVSRAYVGLVESGDRQIDPGEIAKWEEVTGVPREVLRADVFERRQGESRI